ncbi:MAG: hypothetical protein KGJ23_11235 [Euryarchaeota archaeon]|nr:hypothetical protein [Euryarchaeota archaeon]MDE1837167.1 hypothetical protein [Euryarchaeota archaeon]MDE1881495.1 hypothetical protein [Euryarchaeota archaeon]MDE2045323.1 hypothetical protein [Thermoplasmata archaeon]
MCSPSSPRFRSKRAERTTEDDSWVDRVADEVQALLRREGLDLELVVFYDRVTEMLHAVGYDGAPARYFRCTPGEAPLPATPEGTTSLPQRVPTSASLAHAATSTEVAAPARAVPSGGAA